MPLKTMEALRVPALLGAAVIFALAANALAPAHRKLSWTGWAPPPTLQLQPATPSAAPSPPPSAPEPALAPRPIPGIPQKTGQAPTPAPVPAPASPFAPAPDATTREITSGDAWAAFQLKLPFLDARRSEDFLEGHVPGAHSVPIWEADPETRITRFEAAVNPAPRSPIVLYCGGGGCEDSHLLAQKLVSLGYRNLLIYRDGFPDWAAKGRPTAQGARP
jgi:rhodanese-related sulfurtransferase